MAQKKDSKGRNLNRGEEQLADGRYRYRYTDKYGHRRMLYSWKLVPTDKTPKGKVDKPSLREQIKELQKNIDDGIDTYRSESPVKNMVESYLDSKINLANTTKQNYIYILENVIGDHSIGNMRICDVKKSDIQKFYAYLYKERQYTVGTIQIIQNVLYPAFQMSVDDNVIRTNPCRNCMRDFSAMKKKDGRISLTKDQQTTLLNFIKDHVIYRRYYVIFAFMLGTGTRISETIGITWNDIDFEKKRVKIDHQVLYRKKDGKCQFYASETKTKNVRYIPLQDTLIEILKTYKAETYFLSLMEEDVIDGYKNFVFINSRGNIYKPATITRACKSIQGLYNQEEMFLAEEEKREPVLLPEFSPHVFRHTFCTRMAENKIDVKVLQMIMGHASIVTTMDIYNHINVDHISQEIESLQDVLAI